MGRIKVSEIPPAKLKVIRNKDAERKRAKRRKKNEEIITNESQNHSGDKTLVAEQLKRERGRNANSMFYQKPLSKISIHPNSELRKTDPGFSIRIKPIFNPKGMPERKDVPRPVHPPLR